jgi:phage baseplate assembly protein W
MSKENPIYSDLNNEFKINDYTGDVLRKIDAAAIRQSLSNLFRTKNYDRCFHPEIGTFIENLIFKPADSFYIEAMKSELELLINNYEPRIKVITLDILQDRYNPSFVKIRLSYEILNIGIIDTYEFQIQRVL